jgi:hypothetical protein
MPKTEHETNRSGLFTRDEAPVPLTGVSVEAEITSFCARISVTQRYVNRESTPIEAVYVFPLDEGAAVCGFEAIVDDTVVIGEVKEREEAFRMYDDAMERGHGAFLLDEERPDVFQASVGNLPPGKEALLKLTYVTELSVADGGLRFAIPTTVSPRYSPAEDQIGVGRPDSEALNPPRGWRVPYGLSLSVRIAMPGAISHVESPSHPVSVSVAGNTAAVALSQREAALDRDFVLSLQAIGLDTPQAWIERNADDHSHAIAIVFTPTLGVDPVPTEVIFVVDRSGSMGGSSIEEVRNALQLCLRSMIPGCRFNIIGFGSRYDALFPASQEYDERSLKAASDHVAAMQADLGGTEILPALKFVLEQKTNADLTRQVVVLTDGEVTNTDAVLTLVKQHAAQARVFTFGIGAGASHHLVRGLARAGGGSAEFIYPGERIESKVVRQFGRLLSPALTDVRVEWSNLTVTQAPTVVPPVFASGRLLIYGLDSSPAGSPVVRLTATGPAGPMRFDVPVDFSSAVDGRTVATLAARARIRELEESPEWMVSRGSRQRERKATGISREIVALSIRFGLISRDTSFVAVERRETPVLGDVQLRRIPIALTSGWGGLEDEILRGRVHAAHAMPSSAGAPVGAGPAAAALNLVSHPFEAMQPLRSAPPARPFLARAAERLSRARPTTPGPNTPSGMHGLIALQRADGWWELTQEFAAIVGHEWTDLEAAVSGASGPRDEVRRAWATALALDWLVEHASGTQDQWRLLAAKAHKFLNAVTAIPASRGTWIAAARQFARKAMR